MLIEMKKLTKEEFCKITHTDPNSKLFDLLGDAFFATMPYRTEKPIKWYHAGSHSGSDYYGNFEVHEDIREVWVDFTRKQASEFDLEPRQYGFWWLWSKY